MIPIAGVKGAHVRVLGQGPAGRAAAHALAASGAKVSVWDDDAERRGAAEHPVKGARASIDTLAMIVLSDGSISAAAKAILPRAREANIPVRTDLDLFSQSVEAMPEGERPRVVGVTGAAGKSVTVALIAEVLKAAGEDVCIGGSLGRWPLALPKPEAQLTYVVELPMNRLAAAQRFRCDVSVVLGLGPCHGNGLDGSLRAVMRLLRHHEAGDSAIISIDDGIGQKLCTALKAGDGAKVGRAEIIPVSGEASLGHGVFAIGGSAYTSRNGRTQPVGDFSRASALAARHLNQDAAAAIATCLALDVTPPQIVKALHRYKGLEGRFEVLGSEGRIMFVDDSRARHARSVELAVASCPDVFWIGVASDARFSFGQDGPRAAYIVGEGDDPSGLDGTPVSRHAILSDAVRAAIRDAKALSEENAACAPVVLYSPGALKEVGAFRAAVDGRLERRAGHG